MLFIKIQLLRKCKKKTNLSNIQGKPEILLGSLIIPSKIDFTGNGTKNKVKKNY